MIAMSLEIEVAVSGISGNMVDIMFCGEGRVATYSADFLDVKHTPPEVLFTDLMSSLMRDLPKDWLYNRISRARFAKRGYARGVIVFPDGTRKEITRPCDGEGRMVTSTGDRLITIPIMNNSPVYYAPIGKVPVVSQLATLASEMQNGKWIFEVKK